MKDALNQPFNKKELALKTSYSEGRRSIVEERVDDCSPLRYSTKGQHTRLTKSKKGLKSANKILDCDHFSHCILFIITDR
jgi:hypothetical protein